jgi:hypothetical protein
MYRNTLRTVFSIALIPLLSAFTATAMAIQVTDNLDLGGAVRARWDYDPDRDIQKFNFDTAFLSAKYNSDTWIAAAKYRFYGRAYPYQYTNNVGDVSFAESAWVGYKFSESRQVQVGLNQVPFGLQPYFGSSFYETLGNANGLEDLNEIGAKYIQQVGDWNIQTGYYLRPAWQGKGTSKGDTYSTVVSEADSYVTDGSNNQERNTVALRIAKAMELGPWTSEVGISGLTSTLQNNDTMQWPDIIWARTARGACSCKRHVSRCHRATLAPTN